MSDRSILIAALQQARDWLNQNDMQRAEIMCARILSNEPIQRDALELLTQCQVKRGAHQDAIGTLEILLDNYPDDPKYYGKLAELHSQLHQVAEAINAHERLLHRYPHVALAHYQFARLLNASGHPQRAIEEYRKALHLGINNPEEVMVSMANAYALLRQQSEAIALLRRAITLQPDYLVALFNLASLVEETGDREQAESLYRRVVQLQPSFEQAFARLAHLREFNDCNDPLITQMLAHVHSGEIAEYALESIHFGLGKAFDDCGDYDAAFEHYCVANRLSRNAVPVYVPARQEELTGSIITMCSKAWLQQKELSASTATPIFICGMFRSGTTLLEQILGAHPDLTPGGELAYFSSVATRALSPYPMSLGSIDSDALQQIADGYIAFIEERFPDATRTTDKRPDNFLYLGVIKALFPRAKIVYATRHPLDNALSVFFQHLDGKLGYATDLEHILHYNGQLIRLMHHWHSVFGEDILQVHYDEFVTDQRHQTERLLAFCELQWHEGCLRFHARDNNVSTASLWQVRKPLYQKSSGRWRHYRAHLEPLVELAEQIGSKQHLPTRAHYI